jgi:hypothetical protein
MIQVSKPTAAMPPSMIAGGDGCGRHGLTVSAGILRANVTMDEKLGRFDIQLLSNVFAGFD